MKRIILTSVFSIIVVHAAPAQTNPHEGSELTSLLREFLAGASRNDPMAHDRFWADDLVYTRGTGVRVGKADIMRAVRSSTPVKVGEQPTSIYTAEDVRVQLFGNVGIVAYRLVVKTIKDGAVALANYFSTDVFVKRSSKWQVVSHQVTPIPEPKQPEK